MFVCFEDGNVEISFVNLSLLSKITKISISLGSLVEHGEEILAENLEFNIKMLAQNGLAQGLEVKIKKIPGNSWILEKIQGE